MSQYPPPDYIKKESIIDGIEIYVPAPEKEESYEAVQDFKCPQCGGVTSFNVTAEALKCKHCGYIKSPSTEIVGRDAQQYEFTLETLERAARGWGDERKTLACQNCGAEITLPINALTTTCPYCSSNKVIHYQASQEILRPRFLIPFHIETESCKQIVQKWLGSSWMTPNKLKELKTNAEFFPIFIPFWTFDALASANWQAEVGHTKTERYYDHSDRAWKTRTKIVWQWESGNVQLNFDDVIIKGTKRISPLLLDRVGQFDTTALVPYEPSYLAGFQAQAYDIPLELAWEESRRGMRETTRQACVNQASTSQLRNFCMNLDFADEAWRYLLLPLYVYSYVFEGQIYQILINGQNGGISGQRPVDWLKVWLVILALLTPGTALGVIGVFTLLFAGIGVVIGGFGFILLVIGIILAVIIFQKAQGLDDA
jgi:DNA-directed RNA polymerase subunit RPC12/RpoP